MRRSYWGIIILLTLFLGLVLFGLLWRVAEEPKVYRIGILSRGSFYESAVEGYKAKMKELGYIEGENVEYDIRFVTAREELPKVIREFIANGVDLIHTYSTPATQAAYQETKNLSHPIPIVFGSMGDPLVSGVVENIQRPGTNVTGVASLSTELTARRLELLREINPAIRRVAMPHTAKEAGDAAANKSVEVAKETAQRLGIELRFYPVRDSEDNKTAAQMISRRDVEGIIVGGDSLIWGVLELYAQRAIKEKIPLAAFDISHVQKGALIGFGPDYFVSGGQSAVLTNQILRGRNPAEIAIEVPQKLLMIVNLDTAKAIGLEFSEEFLKQVDIIIGGK